MEQLPSSSVATQVSSAQLHASENESGFVNRGLADDMAKGLFGAACSWAVHQPLHRQRRLRRPLPNCTTRNSMMLQRGYIVKKSYQVRQITSVFAQLSSKMSRYDCARRQWK